jgi:ABC-type dipeptide/oligopeptide/nickel transport system permease component
VLERDYFMVQATILIYAAVFVFINFLMEVIHGGLDPRVRLE